MQHKIFGFCSVCRSKLIYDDYIKEGGEFEVTMLLNTTLLTVVLPFDKTIRNKSSVLDRDKIGQWIEENGIFIGENGNCVGKHIKNSSCEQCKSLGQDNGKLGQCIEETGICIKIEMDDIKKNFRKNCVDYIRNGLAHGNIETKPTDSEISHVIITQSKCTLAFSIEKLEALMKLIVDMVLKDAPKDICDDCKWKNIQRIMPHPVIP